MESFRQKLELVEWASISQKIHSSDKRSVERALSREGSGGLDDFVALLSPLAGEKYLVTTLSLSKACIDFSNPS